MLAAIAAGIALVYVSTYRDGALWGDDFAQYIQHASNILSGRPYTELPYAYDAVHRKPLVYPPGLPLMLTVPYAFFGAALTPMKVMLTLCLGAALLLLGMLTRDTLRLRSRIALLALTGLHPYFWDFKDEVMSDWPFLALALAVLLVTERMAKGESARPWRDALGAGVMMAAAILLRTHGIVLIPMFVVAVMIARQPVMAPVLAGAAVATATAVAMFAGLPLLSTYRDIGESSAWHFVESLVYYTKSLALLWDNGSSVGLRAAMFVATSAIAFVAIASRIRQLPRARELFILAYVAVLCSFGGWSGMRYLIPIYVLYLVYVLEGIEVVGRRWGARAGTGLLAVLLVASGAIYAVKYRTMDLKGPLDTARPDIVELWQFLQTEVPENAVIQFERVRAGTLYSGRRGSEYLGTEDDRATWARLDRARTTHLTFIPPFDGAHWEGFLARNARCLVPIFANPSASVYEIKLPAAREALGCR